MPQSSHPYLSYPLPDGAIGAWLVAGPQARPLDLPMNRDALADAADDPDPGFSEAPLHLASLEVSGASLTWEVAPASIDHCIHGRDTYETPHYLRSWAYAEVVCPEAWRGAAVLTAHGPVALWCDGERVGSDRAFAQPVPRTVSWDIALHAGTNRILVRWDQVAWGPTPYALGLRLPGLTGATVQLPAATDRVADFHALAALFDLAYLERDVFLHEDNVAIRWPEDLEARCAARSIPAHPRILLRVQKPDGRIFAETLGSPRAGEPTKTIPALNLPPGHLQAVLMPDPETYAAKRVRVRRVFDLTTLPMPPAEQDDRAYAKRLYGAVHLALREAPPLLSALAAMTLDAWHHVDGEALAHSTTATLDAAVDRDRALLALLGMRYRYADHPDFPVGVADVLDDAVAHYAGSGEAPIPLGGRPVDREVNDLVRLAVALLAGQAFPDRVLGDGRTGQAMQDDAAPALAEQLFRAGRYGMRALLDDGEALDTLIFALSHVADLAEATLIRELAAILLDKVLFTAAMNSFRGMGRGGVLGTTATLGRALWGAGVLGPQLWAVVGLANARAYPLPPLLAAVARGAEVGAPPWQREHHRDPAGTWAISRATYRTPAAMLTSVNGHGAETAPDNAGGGPEGYPEGYAYDVAWRALLDAEAAVTVNAPVTAALRGPAPTFWTGDRVPPQVAQWRDALIARYPAAPAGDTGLAFTHAYFPAPAMDEHVVRDGWAFGRKGDAYVALSASQPMAWVTEGPGAHRELRVPDSDTGTVWFCQMGRSGEDGDFAAFQAQVLASVATVDDEAGVARWTTPRGATLAMDADGALTVDGERQAPDAAHYATPYCTVGFPAETMDIRVADKLLRLDFS